MPLPFNSESFLASSQHLLEAYFDAMCEDFADSPDPAQRQFEANAEELAEHFAEKDKTSWSKEQLGLLALLCNSLF